MFYEVYGELLFVPYCDQPEEALYNTKLVLIAQDITY
jgi:hypothetical protein